LTHQRISFCLVMQEAKEWPKRFLKEDGGKMCEKSGLATLFFLCSPIFFSKIFIFLHPAFCDCDQAEKDLIFAGFIAFECLVRRDSALVIGALNESGHKAGTEAGEQVKIVKCEDM